MSTEAEPFRVDIGGDHAPTVEDLCARLRHRLVRAAPTCPVSTIDCEVAVHGTPDLATIEALALLHLTARRCGASIAFRCPKGRLIELIELMGLHQVLHVSPPDPP